MTASEQVPPRCSCGKPAPEDGGREGVCECCSTCLGWWAISGDALLDALRRVYVGQDPDLVYAELYANSEQEEVR